MWNALDLGSKWLFLRKRRQRQPRCKASMKCEICGVQINTTFDSIRYCSVACRRVGFSRDEQIKRIRLYEKKKKEEEKRKEGLIKKQQRKEQRIKEGKEITVDEILFNAPKLKKKKKARQLRRQLKILKKEILELRAGKKIKTTTSTVKEGFYHQDAWRELRYKAIKVHIKINGRKCLLCFRENVELHVDHIKPRSKYPELELDPNNFQVLCKDCNLGKSNKDETDFRNI